jgi:hypothetical protein
MLIMMIWNRAIQNSGVASNDIFVPRKQGRTTDWFDAIEVTQGRLRPSAG